MSSEVQQTPVKKKPRQEARESKVIESVKARYRHLFAMAGRPAGPFPSAPSTEPEAWATSQMGTFRPFDVHFRGSGVIRTGDVEGTPKGRIPFLPLLSE